MAKQLELLYNYLRLHLDDADSFTQRSVEMCLTRVIRSCHQSLSEAAEQAADDQKSDASDDDDSEEDDDDEEEDQQKRHLELRLSLSAESLVDQYYRSLSAESHTTILQAVESVMDLSLRDMGIFSIPASPSAIAAASQPKKPARQQLDPELLVCALSS